MKNSACFIGHKKINDTPELWKRLDNIVNGLFVREQPLPLTNIYV